MRAWGVPGPASGREGGGRGYLTRQGVAGRLSSQKSKRGNLFGSFTERPAIEEASPIAESR